MGKASARIAVELDCLGHGTALADVGAGDFTLAERAVKMEYFQHVIALDRGVPFRRLAVSKPDVPGIEVRESDGLAAVAAGEVTHAVMGGFGGLGMTRILEAQADRIRRLERLVLSPRDELAKVRRALDAVGFRRVMERLVWEGGRVRWVIAAVPGGSGGTLSSLDAELGTDAISDADLSLYRAAVARYAQARLAHLAKKRETGTASLDDRAGAKALRQWLSEGGAAGAGRA